MANLNIIQRIMNSPFSRLQLGFVVILCAACSSPKEPESKREQPTLAVAPSKPSIDRIKKLREDGRIVEAIAMTQRMLKSKPKSADLRVLLGQGYSHQKESVKAVREFNIALEINPKHAFAMELKALELRRQDREEEAEELIEKLLRIKPNHMGAWRELARIHQKAGRWEKARDVAKKMTIIAPYTPAHFVRLARACIQLNKLDEAATALRDALKRSPKHTKARAMLAGILTDQGLFLKAMEEAQVLIKIDPEYPNASQLFELAAFMQIQWELGCKHGDGPYAQDDVKSILLSYAAEGLYNAESHYPLLVSRYGHDPRLQAQLKFARRHCPPNAESAN